MIRTLELTREAAAVVRAEIARARGNEVCFAARIDQTGHVAGPRVVARGNAHAVLAAARELEPGTLVLHNHPSGDLSPSDADLDVAARLYAEGLGLAITDNAARELYVVVEPAPESRIEPVDADAVEAALAPGGPVAAAHGAYEDRPMQRDFARAVADAYNQGGVLVAEAGTGTGKSVAYLIPAVRWAIRNRERTVVSTNTINLQEQLVGKDLPFLRAALGESFSWALVKGRGNYVSIRRARLAAAAQGTLFEGSREREMEAVLAWLETTRDGSLQDLPVQPSADVWEEVRSDADVCLRARCPHFEACFYQRARRDAAAAELLVVNHHLLFSDLAVRRATGNYTAAAVLPPYRRVVLDEAHNLEDAATSHLGARVSRRGMLRLLARLERRGKGLLPSLEGALRGERSDLLTAEALRRVKDDLRPAVERARLQAGELFECLERMTMDAHDGVVRMAEGFAAEAAWVEGPADALDSLLILLDELARGLRAVREGLQEDREAAARHEERLLEVSGVEGRLRDAAASLRVAVSTSAEAVPLVRWLERRGGAVDADVTLNAAPVDIGPLLRDALFERVDAAVLTSATLATRSGFDFLRQRLGIGGGLRVTERSYPSPFDFATQALVCVPTDLPAARGPAFDEAVARAVEELARLTDGGIFVLFTSWRSLQAVARGLRSRGCERRWPLFVQGEDARARLLARFTTSGRGILLGVASFWEGVDVPGHPLRGLVIAKLPFKVPSEPLTAARIEALELDGRSGFAHFMLPHAALRLKQGFGRLIRSRADRGAVLLLDGRVSARGYGGYLLESLPPAPVVSGAWTEVHAELRRFYAGQERGGLIAASVAPTPAS